MPTLYPPEYPENPYAPLLAFGPSFSEEIARSIIAAVWFKDLDRPHETDVRVAAALTMLEAFHPRDHLECMLAAQGVAAHSMIMDCYRRIMDPETDEPTAIKIRGNISQLSRTFSTVLRDMERRQSKPLPPRPPAAGSPPEAVSPDGTPSDSSPPGAAPSDPPSRRKPRKPRGTPPAAPVDAPLAESKIQQDETDAIPAAWEESELPTDIETRPDGSPGSLAGYAPKPPVEVFVPGEPPIMIALATRPKEWRMVNGPPDQPVSDRPAEPAPRTDRSWLSERGPLDSTEDVFKGDALARFASARLDPDAPVEPPNFDDEYCEVDLELISSGGDPEAEAERQRLMAAHPEGRAMKTIRYGEGSAPAEPPDKPPKDHGNK